MFKTNEYYFTACLKCCEICGLRYSRSLFVEKLSLYVLYPLSLLIYLLMIMNFAFKHENIAEIGEVFTSVAGFVHLIVRKTVLIVYKSALEDLDTQRSFFWPYDRFDDKTAKIFTKRMSLAASAVKLLIGTTSMSTTFYITAPFFVKTMMLPMEAWIPGNDNTLRIIMYCVEVALFVEFLFFLGAFDGYYLLTCIELKIQFELLCKAVRLVRIEVDGDEVTWEKLKMCSSYHRFLLEFHKKLAAIFSEYFLCLYLLTVAGICIPILVLTSEEATIVQRIESVSFIVVINYLFIMAMIPSDEVNFSAEVLVDEIYGIDWYNTHDLKILKFILFWLARAQKPLQMSGAGMVEVNRAMMLKIQRIGYSISTVMTGGGKSSGSLTF